MLPSRTALILLFVFLSGCLIVKKFELDDLYGSPDAQQRSIHARQIQGIDYAHEIRPILDRRCVVCHGCYDAPCQLKLTAYEGIERGANKTIVYDGLRLLADDLTRLFVDAHTAKEWRAKDFFPVLNERTQTPEANLQGSLFYRLLELKQKHPLPTQQRLPGSFELGIDRAQQCPQIEQYDAFAKQYPLWGMPYGLPGISDKEFQTLKEWIRQGAPYSEPSRQSPKELKELIRWETFLNGDSLKEQLMSRYIYEHLFLAHLYFEDSPAGAYYELVRSSTPPGEPLQIIATRRVFDDPGVKRVFYRLRQVRESIVEKSHLPYLLNQSRMLRWKDLFLEREYPVTKLPGYEPESASNPFLSFRDIPEDSRYKFMLDEAQFTIMGFIKGPVCRGHTALNVIDEHFWVMFLDPNLPLVKNDSTFLSEHAEILRLPAELSSEPILPTHWLTYSKHQRKYVKARRKFLKKNLEGGKPLTLDIVWSGEDRNQNAALTIFRHFDSASVVRGFVGNPPKTAWLIGYSLLERMHYLLVAGFDVHGNYVHQVMTRLYMDFLRMEGESNFLNLLPEKARISERNFWYRGAETEAKKYMLSIDDAQGKSLGIPYSTDNPKQELFSKLNTRLSKSLNRQYEISSGTKNPKIQEQLQRLQSLKGEKVSILPQTTFLEIKGIGVFTLLANSAFRNLSSLLDDQANRVPNEDTLTVASGFIGAYPNIFLQVQASSLPRFVDAVLNLRDENDYRKLLDEFGVRRTNPKFWQVSDHFQELFNKSSTHEVGIFDYNRLENR